MAIKMKLIAFMAICAVGLFMMTACGGGDGASTDGDGASAGGEGAGAESAELTGSDSNVELAPYLFVKGKNLEFYGIEFMIPEGLEVARGKIEEDSVCLYRGGDDWDQMIRVTTVSEPDDGFGETPDLINQADALYVTEQVTESDMTQDFWEQGYYTDGDLLPFIRMGYERDNGTHGYLISFIESERRYEDGYPKLYTIYMEYKGDSEEAENEFSGLIQVVSETLATWHLDQRRTEKLSDMDSIRHEMITDEESKLEAIKTANDYITSDFGYSEPALYEKMEEAGYSKEDIEYAVPTINADWYKQAMIRAEFFARDGVKSELELKELLEGEQFEEDQAEYGAVKALQ